MAVIVNDNRWPFFVSVQHRINYSVINNDGGVWNSELRDYPARQSPDLHVGANPESNVEHQLIKTDAFQYFAKVEIFQIN